MKKLKMPENSFLANIGIILSIISTINKLIDELEELKSLNETNNQLKRIADLMEDAKNCKRYGH